MAGQPEAVSTTDDGKIIQIARGTRGTTLINLTKKNNKVKIATTLPDGAYTDAVHGTPFTVSEGILTGTLSPETTYILYAAPRSRRH
ncbi:MAG: hypothetical protein K2I57_02935, partial [Muribaculaceae bacterium]|nr:hypothetical protein [Muribaculaceae bacterium]